MRRAVVAVVALVALGLSGCGEPTCPEGQRYDSGYPVYVLVGKVLVPTYPDARCVNE